MVGVPRSKGCQLCVKRRVKCDEQRPQCRNCLRYGAECPGFDRTFKFVDRKHRPAARPGAPGTTTLPNRTSSSSTAVIQAAASSSRSSTSSPASSWMAPSPTLINPNAHRGQYICTMLDSLYRTLTQTQMALLSPWFIGVEEYLGSKATLDSAMMSFILHMQGKANNDAGLLGESRYLYWRSLGILQDALRHQAEWRTTQTLCASLILSFFELFAGSGDTTSWMKHATGLGQLIQARGPGAYLSTWDQTVLKSSRPILIMNDLFSIKECFLAEPAWQGVLLSLTYPDTGDDTLLQQRRIISDAYFAHLAKLPGIMKYFYPLRQARKAGISVDASALAPLAGYVAILRQEFLAWAEAMARVIPGPTEIPSQDPVNPFDMVFEFENEWFGSLYMGYWASMLILQESILQCEENEALRRNNQELVQNIFRSLETVGAGVMGPYRVGYSVRVAYDFADDETKVWFHQLLLRYEKLYGGLQEKSFESGRTPTAEPVGERAPVNEAIPSGM